MGGETYLFIGSKNLTARFCSLDLKDEYECPIFNRINPLDKFEPITHLFNEIVTSKKAYKDLSLEEKVRIGLSTFYSYMSQADELEVLGVGKIVKGEAYYHEVDQYYMCIGLQVKYRVKYVFDGGGESESTDIGLFSIYVGKYHPLAPVTWSESSRKDFDGPGRFYNGSGDHFVEMDFLVGKEIVDECVKSIDLNVYRI